MNLFYKIHLQAFSLISIVLYHSGSTFGQVLFSCQDAFVVDTSDYSGHLIRHLLNASEAFPTEWFFQFWEQVKVWWARVRTVQRVGKHLPSILFQNLRYCTWGMRPRVIVPKSSQFLLPFQGSVLQNRDHVPCDIAHSVLYWSLAHNCCENQNDCIILQATQSQCADFWNDLLMFISFLFSTCFGQLCAHHHTRSSSIQSDKYQVSHRHSIFSCWWAHSCPKHVEKRKEINIQSKIVHQVGSIYKIIRGRTVIKT
jgi:hypothetical protein